MARYSFAHAGAGVALLLSLAGSAWAQQVTRNIGNGWTVTTPNVDVLDIYRDTTVSGGIPVLEKFATFVDFSPLDLIFTQIAPNAETATRIIITDEYVFNNTGLAWDSFFLSLVNDLNGLAVFNEALSDPSLAPFTDGHLSPDHKTVEAFDGTVPHFSFWTPGVASGAFVIDIALSQIDSPEFRTSFTLRETPGVVPAPAPAALAIAGGLLASRRRRAVVKGGSAHAC
ncbi:MAG: hypothetical protein ACKVS8_05720 [Phycisphaerales bacterium]